MTAFVKNGLVLLGLIVVGGLGYYLFVINGSSDLNSDGVRLDEARLASQQFLTNLNVVKSIELDQGLLMDDRFRSLQSFSTPVIPQPSQRQNPFAPAQ